MAAMAGGLTIITPPAFGLYGLNNQNGYNPGFGGPAGALATIPGQAPPSQGQQDYKAPPKPGSMENFNSITVGKNYNNSPQVGQQISGNATATSGNTINIMGRNLMLEGVQDGGYITQKRLSNILSTGITTCTIVGITNPPTAECSIIGQSINSAMGNPSF